MNRYVLWSILGVFGLMPLAAQGQTKLEVYGHADVSMDYVDRGLSNIDKTGAKYSCGGVNCVPVSPYTQESSNLSYLGFRVEHDIGDSGLRGLLQFETQVDVAATANQKDSLGSRDSYIGLAGGFGAVKLGKSDTPYKKSTSKLDPFSASVGDYNSIMGNTGGDNRAEFDLRLPHAAWWESPKMGTVQAAFMYAPAQNRSADTSGPPEGEEYGTGQLCSGSSPYGSGAIPPCNDGSFGDAYSGSIYSQGENLYWATAYEVHERVNRSGDDLTNFVVGVHNESAAKVAAQYKTNSVTVNGIFESLMRDRHNEPKLADERTRTGYYLSGVQRVGESNELSLAWAHANKTPGDPTIDKALNNQANMYALGYRKYLDKSFNLYAIYAMQANSDGAHYDLGASGHGIPIVGRDGQAACDGSDGCLPTKTTGKGEVKGVTISAFSIGMAYTFNAPFSIGK